MSEAVRITVLVENSVQRGGLGAEHGLSFHVQIGRRSLLFDTGQTALILRNAQTLSVEMDHLDAVVLSHGHYDHTGGLSSVLASAPKAKVFLHPAAFAEKFSRSSGQARSIGMGRETRHALREHHGVVETTCWTQVCDKVFVTGEIPRRNSFEDTGGAFFLDAEGQQPDPLADDQALVMDLGEGLVVLSGCAHAGVVNTLEHVRQFAGNRPVQALVGGLHLSAASPERMGKTLQAFQQLDIRHILPGHCTGIAAISQLWTAFPGRCASCSTGTVLVFK